MTKVLTTSESLQQRNSIQTFENEGEWEFEEEAPVEKKEQKVKKSEDQPVRR
jgi:hypothetical protein